MNFFPAESLRPVGIQIPSTPECGRCGLYRGCQSPKMPPTGRGKRRILFVGEAPGEEEDRRGRQFVGKSGKLLRRTLAKLGLDLGDAHKTNAAICHPPRNKIEDRHVDCCRPNLLHAVRDLQPRVVVLLGASATRSLIQAERADVGAVTRWVGWRIPSPQLGCWICPTWHPAHILRQNNATLEELWKGHLQRALELEGAPVASEGLPALRSRVEVVLSGQEASQRLGDLAQSEGVLAFDYEASAVKPDHPRAELVACSFALDGERAWSCRILPEHLPLLRRVLRAPKLRKVAHNLKNEERWTLAKLGCGVRGWYWDSMLAAHWLDNRGGVSSLKFQAYVQFGVPDYNQAVTPYFRRVDRDGINAIGECPEVELLTYNGLDSLLTWRLAARQRKQAGLPLLGRGGC